MKRRKGRQSILPSTIFSSPKKLTADPTASGTYFDGDMLKNAWVVENTDIGHYLDRPWGIANTDLLSGIPADTVITTFTMKMAAYKEDTIRNLIGAIKGAQPTSPPGRLQPDGGALSHLRQHRGLAFRNPFRHRQDHLPFSA